MGCDIHPTIEWLEYPAKGIYADRWMPLSYDPMSWGRDYGLFARMAGVRCHCADHPDVWICPKAKYQPRGLPDNVSGLRPDNSDDMHTPSWLTVMELKEVIEGYDCLADVYASIAAMEEFERRGYKARLVFAFDN